MFQLEVLAAKHGDCLILHYGSASRSRMVLIDGGPRGVYKRYLRKRLKELREADSRDRPPEFELAMVSHIDDDHIAGLLDLTKEMVDREGTRNDPARIKRFWVNTFEDVTGNKTQTTALASTEMAITASADAGGIVPFKELEGSDGRASHILAGLGQGRKLRDNLEALGIDGNQPFDGTMVLQGKSAKLPGGLEFDIIGPDVGRLTALQKKWNPNLSPTEIAGIADRSVANLSSIVTIAKYRGKTILLTGDARGDDIVDWLKDTKNLDSKGKAHFDVLKMPHHGSDRNVDKKFFQTVTADIYVYCGDGHHDNPDYTTMKMMRETQKGRDYTVVLSNAIKMEHEEKQPDFDKEMKKLKDAGANIQIRDPDELSMFIKLS